MRSALNPQAPKRVYSRLANRYDLQHDLLTAAPTGAAGPCSWSRR